MSSDQPIPRTAVALGITDPVESARAELKAALAAIEEKANVPKRVANAADRAVGDARTRAILRVGEALSTRVRASRAPGYARVSGSGNGAQAAGNDDPSRAALAFARARPVVAGRAKPCVPTEHHESRA